MNKKIIDVAKRASVSPATVSRVLNGSSLVNEKTREKVETAIQELGYYPNAAAKNLRSQRTMTIGVIVSDINVSYYAEIVKGIQNIASPNRYKVIICDADSGRTEEEYLNLLLDRTVDGLIIVNTTLPEEKLTGLVEKGLHIGVVGRNIEHPLIPCVYTDNIKLSREAVHHLLDSGCRSVAFIGGDAESEDSIQRLEGYKQALAERGITFRPELFDSGSFNEHRGYEAFKRIRERGIPFDGIFCANDEMALGVYMGCSELNLRIPEDLAVMGVDNIRITRYIAPAMSTVSQPTQQMGAKIAELLIDRMEHPVPSTGRVRKIESALIVRESSTPIRR